MFSAGFSGKYSWVLFHVVSEFLITHKYVLTYSLFSGIQILSTHSQQEGSFWILCVM